MIRVDRINEQGRVKRLVKVNIELSHHEVRLDAAGLILIYDPEGIVGIRLLMTTITDTGPREDPVNLILKGLIKAYAPLRVTRWERVTEDLCRLRLLYRWRGHLHASHTTRWWTHILDHRWIGVDQLTDNRIIDPVFELVSIAVTPKVILWGPVHIQVTLL
jgi:hypothetical protein